jgi:DNA-binding NarL/FixJ family response regulator
MQQTKLMIVDDHPLVRNGLRQLLETESDFIVSAEAESISQAINILEKTVPDVVIIDLSLPDGNGLELIRRIAIRHPEIGILVSSMHDEDLFAERAFLAGANGYINKQEASEKVILALRQILNGETYMSEKLSAKRILEQTNGADNHRNQTPEEQLSNREIEVFELIGHGMSTSEIAAKLHLSIKTIESHRANIKTKLGLTSSGELIRSAVQWTLDS